LKIKSNNADPKAIHICNSHNPTLQPKIAKEYVLPAHVRQKKSVKLKEKMTEMNEHQAVINRTLSGLQDPAMSRC